MRPLPILLHSGRICFASLEDGDNIIAKGHHCPRQLALATEPLWGGCPILFNWRGCSGCWRGVSLPFLNRGLAERLQMKQPEVLCFEPTEKAVKNKKGTFSLSGNFLKFWSASLQGPPCTEPWGYLAWLLPRRWLWLGAVLSAQIESSLEQRLSPLCARTAPGRHSLLLISPLALM